MVKKALKWIVLSAILAMIIIPFRSVSANDDTIHVFVDGSPVSFDVPPQIIDGRTMVPIRAIFEQMGATVNWNEETHTASCIKDDTTVNMQIGSEIMTINDTSVPMDVAPQIIDGRTLAPARYVAEAYGNTVQWSNASRNVVITSKDVYAYADYPDVPDLGKCYGVEIYDSVLKDGTQCFSYLYSDFDNDDYYSYLFDHSSAVLGSYREETASIADGVLILKYTKPDESTPRFTIGVTYATQNTPNDTMIFTLCLPANDALSEKSVTLYAADGRTLSVAAEDVPAYLAVGWYQTQAEAANAVTLYAADGRTLSVAAEDVPAYLAVGWYQTQAEARNANISAPSTPSSGASSGTSYTGKIYRTPTGKKYHYSATCGGKNSYEVTFDAALKSGLTPCSKCVH